MKSLQQTMEGGMLEDLRKKIEEAIRKGPVYGSEGCLNDVTTLDQVCKLCKSLEEFNTIAEVLLFVNTLMRLMPTHLKEWKVGDTYHGWIMDENFDAVLEVLKPIDPPWSLNQHDDGRQDWLNAQKWALQGRWRLAYEEGFFVWVLTDKYNATLAPKKFWGADK